MRIYNTLTNSIEELKTIEEKKLKLYVCGPTVYNYIHIGNVRPLVVFDILARYFEYKDFEVNYVQNFTDIDDKIIKRANEEGITEEEVTKKYIEAFHEDTSKLNLLKNCNQKLLFQGLFLVLYPIASLFPILFNWCVYIAVMYCFASG